jgi:uncharacterized BrkB/YihY/UPF0761 family membrane protein
MLWFYLLSLILIAGFEVNASIDEAKSGERRTQNALKQLH